VLSEIQEKLQAQKDALPSEKGRNTAGKKK
jgi:hypothetical protein